MVVEYNAGTSVGAATVSLTVTDNDGQQTTFGATVDVKSGISVSADITENTTWETGKVYILEKRTAVVAGATLTIEPGVIVKGAAGTGANATALIIARGGKIMAEGTATQPIIFTSVADNILPGQIESPNLSPDLDGLWGGLLVLGKAKISVSGDAVEKAIEGLPGTYEYGKYGGSDDADNSGVIKYVSIRHGSSNIGEGNEINGLTLGGVGSGTVIENVEIVGNQDDGIEWFGGTVNVKNAVVWNAGDDAIDTDQSWAGTLDNFIVITPFDKCFEIDGPEGSYQARHTIKNGHIKVGKAIGLLDIDYKDGNTDNSLTDFSNLYFYGMDKSWAGSKAEYSPACTYASFEVTSGVDSKDVARTKDMFFATDLLGLTTEVTTTTVGATPANYSGWSWAAVAGAF
ncbi:MAG: hypothetical protein HC831_04300 [Chloroflexia bacterium]|nr:hypothetical protein [Chloroflexia bacterium]